MAVLGVTYPPTQHLIFVQAMPQVLYPEDPS